jgi:telomere length regulation protein
VKEIVATLLLGRKGQHAEFLKLLDVLPRFEQRNVFYSVLKIVSREHLSVEVLSEDNAQWWQADTGIISAAAGLISLMAANEEQRKVQLINWLTGSPGAGSGDGIAIRRAVVAALTRDKTDTDTVLEKSLQQFGDKLYIRHTPTLQQEGVA